jgi:hypothetical protein
MLNKGLAMPCANCIVMGSATNLVLILSHSIACGVMNELVIIQSKKQLTILLFILQFNFNKFEVLLL